MRKLLSKLSMIVFVTALTSFLLTSCKGPSDSDIQTSVNEKLTSNAGISATVTDGVVTLNR